MLRVMVPGKIKKGQDFQTHVSKWEGWVNKLERDYKEKTSDMAKIGILISMAPDDLQDTILQHADRLKEYKLVKDKMAGLLDARARFKDLNALDIGFAGEDVWWRDDAESSDVDVGCHWKRRPLQKMRWSGPHSQRVPDSQGQGQGQGKRRQGVQFQRQQREGERVTVARVSKRVKEKA